MATSAWTERLRELVAKGPVPFNRALSEMSRLVPPGRAFRDAQRYVDWNRTARGKSDKAQDELTVAQKDALVDRGQHRLAYTAIWTYARAGRVEVYEEGNEKMIRTGPKWNP